MYVATGEPNVKWGGTDFKWGAGHHWPPAGDGPARNPRGLTRPAQGSSSHFSGCDGKSVKRSFLCDIATDVDI